MIDDELSDLKLKYEDSQKNLQLLKRLAKAGMMLCVYVSHAHLTVKYIMCTCVCECIEFLTSASVC